MGIIGSMSKAETNKVSTQLTWARENNLIACFMSKPFMGVSASGCHHNVSLWTGGKDSALALYEARSSGCDIRCLATFAPPEPRFLAMIALCLLLLVGLALLVLDNRNLTLWYLVGLDLEQGDRVTDPDRRKVGRQPSVPGDGIEQPRPALGDDPPHFAMRRRRETMQSFGRRSPARSPPKNLRMHSPAHFAHRQSSS